MIENTSGLDSQEAFLADAMVNAVIGGLSPGDLIELQEARGQQELVCSDRMPSELTQPREDFEALGFVFGAPDAADPLFMPVTLPAGWSREASEHSMWSYITDEHGRRRVGIFYKAAFYDRKAHASLRPVYTYVFERARTGQLVVTDDTWATPAAVTAAAEAHIKDVDDRIEILTRRLAKSDAAPDSHSQRLAEDLAEAKAERVTYERIKYLVTAAEKRAT